MQEDYSAVVPANNIGVVRRDGRSARSAGTRSAVVDALLALIEGGELRPTAPRIAERAGVSLRSVFQHFADMETLFAAAADRQMERILSLLHPISPDPPLHERMAAFVAQRARVLEAITPVRRAALLMEPFSAEIAERLRRVRVLGRTEIEQVFAPELGRRGEADRRELLAALVVASSWSTWEPLRAHQGLPVEQARKVLTRVLNALLSERAAN
jgi:TetR/AcrR family transcriptional regulator, regulator of autoinduction and epiphytic fitness